MKLIHWAIIFIVLVVPFSLVAREAITNKNLVLRDQTRINNVIDNATYDAVSQILELSDEFGLGKDIPITHNVAMASIDRFFQSMAVNFNLPNDVENAKGYFGQYIPVILIVGYDGLYVYSYDLTSNGYEYVLKPKIPYTYTDPSGVMINFTLGNDVTLYYKNGFLSGDKLQKISGKVSDDFSEDEKMYGFIETEHLDFLAQTSTNISYVLDRIEKEVYNSVTVPEFLYNKDIQDYEYDEKTGDVTVQAGDFNKIRRKTIISLITSVLEQEIHEHNTYADIIGVDYAFNIPDIADNEWNNTIDDISVLAFFQGMPVGASSYNNFTGSYYNNYSLGGARIVQKKYIYATNNNLFDGYKGKYHKWNCPQIDVEGDSDSYDQIFLNEKDAIKAGYYACEECR